jgi:hypothetical protein
MIIKRDWSVAFSSGIKAFATENGVKFIEQPCKVHMDKAIPKTLSSIKKTEKNKLIQMKI